MAVVAAVSGRSADFLEGLELAKHRSRLRVIGWHGLEEWSPGGTVSLREGVAWRPVIERAHDRLVEAVPSGARGRGQGLWDHGALALGDRVDGRAGSDRNSSYRDRDEDREPSTASRRVPARQVWGARTSTWDRQGHRRDRARWGLEAAAYLGDDLGDLRAFRALDGLEASYGLRGIRIAVNGAEAPEQLLKEADLIVEGPSAAALFLEALEDCARRT